MDKYIIIDNKLIINSIDRDWYNNDNETPCNFIIKINGGYNNIIKSYKNIIEFSIDKLILPSRNIMFNYNMDLENKLSDNAYLIVNIKGLEYASYGTNIILNKALGIFTPSISLNNIDTKYLEYKNTSEQKKIYHQMPDNNISLLDLNITNNNNNLEYLNDVLQIYSIYLNTSNISNIIIDDNLIIQTSTYFNINEFKINDIIKIQNYQYHNMSYDESNIFNNWINSNNGHQIISISKSDSDTILYNRIHIPLPATLSRLTGLFTIAPWFNNFIIKTFNNIPINDTNNKIGKLINTNLQTHIIINIKTLE